MNKLASRCKKASAEIKNLYYVRHYEWIEKFVDHIIVNNENKFTPLELASIIYSLDIRKKVPEGNVYSD